MTFLPNSTPPTTGAVGLQTAEAGQKLVPPGRLGTACITLLGGSVLMSALDVPLEIYLVSAFDRAAAVGGITATTDNVYFVSSLLNAAQFLFWVATGIAFITLLRRIVKNGATLHPGRADHKTHWAITGWFVPFLNLVRPFDMVKQAWYTNPPPPTEPQHGEPPGYFKTWWGLFLVGNFVDRFAFRRTQNGFNTMEQFSTEAIWMVVSHAFTIASGVAFFYVLRALIKRQNVAIEAAWAATTAAISTTMHNQPQFPAPGSPSSEFGGFSEFGEFGGFGGGQPSTDTQ